ncbi:MAG: hypothetical protein JOZ43_01640, partial [Acidobacteriales bacterium]|nr:hypothetical protein [Terriglobales bacterium]
AQAHGVAIPFNIFGHHNAYANSNGGAMSSGINAQGGWMDIYEASFYGPQTNPVPQPNVLAAAFIHEWVHWNQPYYGWPEPKYNVRPYSGIFFPPGDVEVDLNELMAYDRSSISTFYKLALTPQEFSELVTQPRSIYISKFAQDWAKLNPAEKKAIANWAWSRPDGFMRRMMYGFPAEDGGAWGALCTANTGTGPCGMVH